MALSHHCPTYEQIIFSCAVGGEKTLFICADPTLSASAGYLHRFGTVGRPLELVFSDRLVHPSRYFHSGTLAYSGGGGAYLAVARGEYRYIVYTAIGRGWRKEGVAVERDGKFAANLACQGPWQSIFGPDLFHHGAIPIDPDFFEVP